MRLQPEWVKSVLDYLAAHLLVAEGVNDKRPPLRWARDDSDMLRLILKADVQGSLEAIVQSLRQAIPMAVDFSDLELHSLSTGEKATGEAEVTISVGGQTYKNTGIDQDVLVAVAKAFISACNQAIRMQSNSPAATEATTAS